jgi:hypothetical protein
MSPNTLGEPDRSEDRVRETWTRGNSVSSGERDTESGKSVEENGYLDWARSCVFKCYSKSL